MRNLKKVLALCLALTMAFGLMISAAAFTDDSQIVNKDAVQMLTELKIIAGFPDGSFQPTGPVTRAQMAKMVYVALRGGVDDRGIAFVNANVPLSDIAGHWAKGYINFAFGSNIISGYPNGTFLPDANVTGYEAAKMMLTALGYSSAIEGYTGTGWDYRVAVDAATAGLLDGIEGVDLSLPLSRDNAAQMIYNAIFAKMVYYDEGNLTERSYTFAENKLGLETITGVLTQTGIAGFGGASDKGTYTIVENYGEDNENTISDIPGTADVSLLGQTVNAYVKLKSGTDTDDYDGSDVSKTYGTVKVATGQNTVITRRGDSAYKAAPATGYSLTDAEYSVNYVALSETVPEVVPVKGDICYYIDNDNDKKIDVVLLLKQAFDNAVVKTTSSGTTISAPNLNVTNVDIESSSLVITGEIEDGNYVIGYNAMTDLGDADSIYRTFVSNAPTFTGAITATNGNSSKITVNGTAYGFSGLEDSVTYATVAVQANLNKTFTFYTDGAYIIAYEKDEASEPAQYCGIRAVKNGSGSGAFLTLPQVAVTLEDGTEAIYKVAKVDGTKITGTNVTSISSDLTDDYDNQITSYTINSDGNIELGAVVGVKALDSTYTAGSSTLKADSGNYVIDASTVFFKYNGGSDDNFTVYVGKANSPKIVDEANVSVAVVDEDAATLVAAAVLSQSDDTSGKTTSTYGLVLDAQESYDSGYYANVTLFNGSAIVTLTTTKTSDFFTDGVFNYAEGSIIKYTLNSSGKISAITKQNVYADLTTPYDTADGKVTFYVGYAFDYEEGNYITLRPGTTAATSTASDVMWNIASTAYVAQLKDLDATSVTLTGVDPTTSKYAIEDAASATKGNVIIEVNDDGNVIGIIYLYSSTATISAYDPT